MRDNKLIGFIIAALKAGLPVAGLTGVLVKQDYQPTKQGTPDSPTIFIHKISWNRYGFLKRKSKFNAETNVMTHLEIQPIITTFQINAKSIQDPANIEQLTAGDLVNSAAGILNSDAAVAFLFVNDIQVERARQGRQTYFKDDKDRFESDPSIDISFVHEDITKSTIGSVSKVNAGIYPI